jgi:hypothetical protein
LVDIEKNEDIEENSLHLHLYLYLYMYLRVGRCRCRGRARNSQVEVEVGFSTFSSIYSIIYSRATRSFYMSIREKNVRIREN